MGEVRCREALAHLEAARGQLEDAELAREVLKLCERGLSLSDPGGGEF